MSKVFYVYEWYNTETGEVFYVGKGTGDRYKNTRKRNKTFLDYIENNKVDVRIVWRGESEEEAFNKEIEITNKYKEMNQCQCSLAKPGHGGCHFVWTDEMKENWSKHNVMKNENQRERMRNNNPMKNPEIAKKNGKTHKRAIMIGDKNFEGITDAAKYFQKQPTTISHWLKRGKTPNGEECKYIGETSIKEIKRGTQVIVDDILYSSIAKAATAIGVAPSSLRTALLKGNKTCKGHTCEYANQQPNQ